jgi:hypothetical protein
MSETEPRCPWIEEPYDDDTAEETSLLALAGRTCAVCHQHRDLRKAAGLPVDWESRATAYMPCGEWECTLAEEVRGFVDHEPGFTVALAASVLGCSEDEVRLAIGEDGD